VRNGISVESAREWRSWTESIIYSFQGGADGAYPGYGVIFDKFGNLYGTTGEGGDTKCGQGFGCGTFFELSPVSGGGWTETVFYAFTAGADGGAPSSGLTMDPVGTFYGVTEFGGSAGLGTVFELYQSAGTWKEKVLYTFAGEGAAGQNPMGTLALTKEGDLVGTADGGHPNGCCGVVFALVPASGGNWKEFVVHDFTQSEGVEPATVVFDKRGNLYGVTSGGGEYDKGTVYRLTLNHGNITEASFSFCPQAGCAGGSNPGAGVILDSAGNIYGTTELGGTGGWGVVYEITP